MVTSKKQLKEIKKLPLKYTDIVVIVNALLKINSQENNFLSVTSLTQC